MDKTGARYDLVLQAADNIDDMLELQQTIFDALPEKAKAFIVPKDRAFFEQHLAKNNYIIGIVSEGKLIAQGILVHPTQQHPKTGMVDMNLDRPLEKIAVIQGLLVHPEYRGNSLMSLMVDTRLLLSHQAKRTDFIAEVSVENHHSWSVLLKEGLRIHSIGIDPADGTVVYNMHAHVGPLVKQRLGKVFNKNSKKNTVSCHKNDIEKQKELLSKSYMGVSYDPVSQHIAFKKFNHKVTRKSGPKLP